MDQVKKGQYDTVQKLGDEPYEKYAAPTKIPGAALEFDLEKFGKIISNELDIKTGLSVIKFENGIVFNNYIHATREIGYFGFENLPANLIEPALMIPNYNTGKGRLLLATVLKVLGWRSWDIKKELLPERITVFAIISLPGIIIIMKCW